MSRCTPDPDWPRKNGVVDVTAPLPPHMRETWNLFGFDPERYDNAADCA